MIIVTDWGEGGDAKLGLDAERLQLDTGFKVTDFETGQAISRGAAHLPSR